MTCKNQQNHIKILVYRFGVLTHRLVLRVRFWLLSRSSLFTGAPRLPRNFWVVTQ